MINDRWWSSYDHWSQMIKLWSLIADDWVLIIDRWWSSHDQWSPMITVWSKTAGNHGMIKDRWDHGMINYRWDHGMINDRWGSCYDQWSLMITVWSMIADHHGIINGHFNQEQGDWSYDDGNNWSCAKRSSHILDNHNNFILAHDDQLLAPWNYHLNPWVITCALTSGATSDTPPLPTLSFPCTTAPLLLLLLLHLALAPSLFVHSFIAIFAGSGVVFKDVIVIFIAQMINDRWWSRFMNERWRSWHDQWSPYDDCWWQHEQRWLMTMA